MTRDCRLESVREALRRHRQAVDRPISWSIAGLSHYLEEARDALSGARPGEIDSIRALAEELEHHRQTVDLAGLQLQLWRQDFASRSTANETYASDARLRQPEPVRLLAEG